MTVQSATRSNSVRALSGRCARLAAAMMTAMLLSGCIVPTLYVDKNLPAVTVADLKQPANHYPVQVLTEYQTNGSTNAKATEHVAPIVTDSIKQSALFSDVVAAPATADRKLFIKFNNIANMDSAQSKGFATGLTLGLVGSTVTDGIVMEATYVVPGRQDRTHSYKTAVISTIGATASAPPGLTAAPSAKEATHQFVNNLIMNLLNDMSHDGELE